MNVTEIASEILRKAFEQISENQAAIDQAISFIDQWLQNPLFADQHAAILSHIEFNKSDILLDAFHQRLPFGTGGRRGRVGYGPNRINPGTVALSVQGHCNFMKDHFDCSGSPKVIVAYDVRIFEDIGGVFSFLPESHPILNLSSRDLGRIACEIYAANGFTVYTTPQNDKTAYLSTPELSFLIKYYQALGGINVSASHNHPDDNGFKFYNPEAAQDIPPDDERLSDYMNNDTITVNRMDFDDARNSGLILDIPKASHNAYIQTNLTVKNVHIEKSPTVIYTPLCGTGDSNVGEVLRAAGYSVQLYAPHANFDGTFTNVPSRIPNPEVPEAAEPALSFADKQQGDIVLSSDPDADRIGLFAKNSDKQWQYITGNDIASIIAYYLILDKQRGPQKKGLIIKTLVTTRTLENIAKKAHCPIIGDLLVGFKYIAHVLETLEKQGKFHDISVSPQDLVLAAEESHGILLTPDIRDKDAAGAGLILSEIMSLLIQDNIYLPDYLTTLHLECGNYANAARSIVLKGIEGADAIAKMMSSLREIRPSTLAGRPVTHFADYLDESVMGPVKSQTDQLSRNLLMFRMAGTQVVIRPSGTEPKLKLYVDIEGDQWDAKNDRNAAMSVAKKVAAQIYDTCLERIHIRLSDSAKCLPDYIEIKQKQDFDTAFPNELKAFAERIAREKSFSNDASQRISWLKNRLRAYASGADPLIAVKPAVIHLTKRLLSENPNVFITTGLNELISDFVE
ncbi:MAG: phosphomannomutase [Candidatus Magnetoglobus multicellularis str. Araruama]|uniref:Phosphomannomutase n=1 Tax=Candidatus Magnetoglobus multicellularis str. Araruama TaxID=890399 RepID=A0A1V1NY88_9BACT|nr:MAG: phosphomannomutase [Candidatus Magnetoglobus multicellularis str. Araruama]